MSDKIRFVELQDLCTSITDCHHSTPLYTESGKIVIRNFNIKKGRLQLDDISYTDEENYLIRTSRAKPEAGDLIITREAPMGEVCIVPENLECCLGQRMVLLKPNHNKVDSSYLLYTLMSRYVQTHISKSEGTGSIVSNLRIPVLKELNIPIYDIDRQTTIGKILSDIDSKISLNNRINTELEAMAKTMYDYWFVQFDFPNAEGKPYKSSGGKMVWSEELKREVPEGWEVKRLKEFADTGSGGTPLSTNSDYYENGNIPWINSGEVNEPFIVNARKFVTNKGLENSSANLFKRGTILMAMYGATAGKVSIIDIEATTNQAICGIIPQQEDYKMYIKFGLEDMYRYLVNLSTGSARDNLSQDKIKDLQFIIPEKHVLKAFDKTANAAMSKILINMKENLHLSSLRDWLLPMLMNGQVKVNSGYEGKQRI